MLKAKCPQCGASFVGLVCDYCGALAGPIESMEDQKRALDEYHRHLRTGDRKKQIVFLKSGFLPDYNKLLIDAGLTCATLVNQDELMISRSEAAVSRLESIIMKLRILPQDEETKKAAEMLQAKVDKFNKTQEQNTTYGLIFFAVVTALIVLAVWYFKS